jgi:hypothetical protein
MISELSSDDAVVAAVGPAPAQVGGRFLEESISPPPWTERARHAWTAEVRAVPDRERGPQRQPTTCLA